MIVKPRMLTYGKGYQREINCNKVDSEEYYSWDKEIFTLKSDYGYRLSCELLDGRSKVMKNQGLKQEDKEQDSINTDTKSLKNTPEKIAILCHGLGYAKYSGIKYAKMFFRLGYRVIIYDHRNHGYSGKAHTSMGFYEKYDLKKLVDWCYKRYGENCTIVTHGESMGAATVLMHLGIDHRVDYAIADCAYSDLTQLLCHQLKQYYHLPCFLIPIESFLTYLRAGFWYNEVSPIRVARYSMTPVLFIHGKIDNLVPADMTRQMYHNKKRNKAMYLVAGAKHAGSYCKNKEGYEKVVELFLKRYQRKSV
jgi:alpha-beta hydrolase superfamily lysophospholipase